MMENVLNLVLQEGLLEELKVHGSYVIQYRRCTCVDNVA